MKAYILSILGIVVLGVLIDIILPNGEINKYIKSIYSIFVVAVILTPIINFFNNANKISINYQDYEINEKLLNYINNQNINTTITKIKNKLKDSGIENIDIILDYEQLNGEFVIISCQINLKNVSITLSNSHINKYELIKEVVKEYTNLTDEEISFNE